jgi:type III restriction enzyme
MFLKEKDGVIARAWPLMRIEKLITDKLEAAGQDASFLSKENLLILQQGFGPMFRGVNEANPRISQKPKNVVKLDMSVVDRQGFSESTLKQDGTIYYSEDTDSGFATTDEKNLWERYMVVKEQAAKYGEAALNEDAKVIIGRLKWVAVEKLKIPWNLHYASHKPERDFSWLLTEHAGLFESFVRMPDHGFYSFPYSYKPAHAARTHVKNENFNPDFFIRLKKSHHVLAVEIKEEGDDSNRNRAKYRDGKKHFATLNAELEKLGEPWRYHFMFLSPEDYTHFFGCIKDGSYPEWKSSLMLELERS